MSKRNIELYEALKGPVGHDAARMIAEVVPAAEDLATRLDLADLRGEMADLRAEMHREFSHMKGWLFTAMVPVWLGVYGTLITLLVQR